jgi:hypothetical protein
MTKQKGRERRAANHLYFTDATVARLRPKRKQYLSWDWWQEGRERGAEPARGLAILVSPSGTKSYRCVFYYPGNSKPHWKHLGRVGVMTLDEARAATRETQRIASKGDDPTSDDPNKSDRFKNAIEDYIAHEQIGRLGNKSADKTKNVMLALCKGWEHRAVGSIRYREIEQLLVTIRDGSEDRKPTPYMSNRLYSHLRHFFTSCVRRRVITASPMTEMPRPWNGAKARDRAWFKQDDAINAIWAAADTIGGSQGQFIKLLILTGKRPGPGSGLADMRWEHIRDDWFWDAPPSLAKNKRRHPIHLPKRAQRVLHPRQQKGDVFAGIQFSRLQKQVKQLTGMEDFIFHGIRHLVETKLAELKVPPHVRDLLLDHVPHRGAGAGYDHHSYEDETREAIELWSAYVERLVDGGDSKVKALR